MQNNLILAVKATKLLLGNIEESDCGADIGNAAQRALASYGADIALDIFVTYEGRWPTKTEQEWTVQQFAGEE
jgi:hypothetical protein